MPILLICQQASGQIAINNRAYTIRDYHMVLDGYANDALLEDVSSLLADEEGKYRLPTPSEQNAYAESQRMKATIQEGGTHG